MTVQEKLAALMALAYEVNSKTEYAVFCEFSGHVNWISLRVAISKDHPNDVIFPKNYKTGGNSDISLKYKSEHKRFNEWMEYLGGLLKEAAATT